VTGAGTPGEALPIDQEGARAALDRLVGRTAAILEMVGDRFPLFARSDRPGDWETTHDGNWCAGYWIALLLVAAKYCRDEQMRERFERSARGLVPSMLGQETDNLFAGLNHYYAGYVAFDLTGDASFKEVGLRGANAMFSLFNEKARQIPIGTYATAPKFTARFQASMPLDRRYLAAVDAIHTSVPVLFRAFEETDDARFRDVALAHVERHLAWHVRPDGSTIQMTEFDPDTGAPLSCYNPLAANADGCWSRGFAWHIAGLATALQHTGNSALHAALQQATDYYFAHVDGTLVPVWDFSVEGRDALYDASAAAVAACGLVRLTRPDCGPLRDAGLRILSNLIAHYQSRDPSRGDPGAILHGCYRFPSRVAVDNELIWSNFYVALALDSLLANDGASTGPDHDTPPRSRP
jgi:unsaturated chondroitin disaccharide hydrolase